MPTFIRTRLTWQSYAMIGYYSYLLNALGPLTPFLRDELRLSYTVASLHFSAYACGVILAGLIMHRMALAWGVKRLAWGGALGMSLGGMLLIAGRHPAITIPGAFLMGFLGIFLISIMNAALADAHPRQRAIAFSESSVVGSLTAGLSPIAIGFFARTAFGWRTAIALAFLGLPLLWLAFGRYALPAMDTGGEKHTSQRGAGQPLPLVYWLFWLAILLCVAVEFCFIFWAADYLQSMFAMQTPDAAMSVSAFIGAMLVGRWLLSRLLRVLPEMRLLWIELGLTAGGFLLFWIAPLLPALQVITALAGLILAGLGVAGLFPIINSMALEAVPGRIVEASARMALATGGALLLLPFLLARLADTFGIHPAFALQAVLIGLAAILVASGHAATRRVSIAALPLEEA